MLKTWGFGTPTPGFGARAAGTWGSGSYSLGFLAGLGGPGHSARRQSGLGGFLPSRLQFPWAVQYFSFGNRYEEC